MKDASGELVEEVDADGHVLRVVTRREMRTRRLRHRAVFVLVRSTDGRVLVHQRSHDKDVWPGWWDMAVGGVVSAGEAWDDAAHREVAEEIGVLDAVPEPIDGGIATGYDDSEVSLVARCYRLVHDGPFVFADGEVLQARFVTIDELDAMTAVESFLPDSLTLLRDAL